MNIEFDVERLLLAQKAVRADLLAERASNGSWVGEISSSPVATAAAVSALVASHHQDSDDALREAATGDSQVLEQLVQCDLSELVLESVHWLARRQNEDGGWGDCEGNESNVAATLLVQAAFRLTGIPAKYADLMLRADQYVAGQGGLAGLKRQLGRDRGYLAVILANGAMADMYTWRQVPTLAFEWLSLSQRWFGELQGPVTPLSAPIVAAIGLAKFHNDPPRNPISRLLRSSFKKRTLASLERWQASDDSFLGSPLTTAFVVMGLASIGCQEHRIVRRGIEYLLSSVRADASWAVTPNLATLNTALSLQSIGAGSIAAVASTKKQFELHELAQWEDAATTRDTVSDLDHRASPDAAISDSRDSDARSIEWLLKMQQTTASVITGAPAGGWGSSDTAGAVPNTIATANVLLALAQRESSLAGTLRERVEDAATRGLSWLVHMQNSDGGWPTFLHEDDSHRLTGSGVDSTAAAVRAISAWREVWKLLPHRDLPAGAANLVARLGPASLRGIQYLADEQQGDGSSLPLWFANRHHTEDRNPVMGTAQVLAACGDVGHLDTPLAQKAAAWLIASQHSSGGWGPPRARVDYSEDYSDSEREAGQRSWRENDELAKDSSVEETSAALAALVPLAATNSAAARAVARGLNWLTNAVEQDALRRPAIVGFYFPQIWYYERLFPLALAAGVLSRALGALPPARPARLPVA